MTHRAVASARLRHAILAMLHEGMALAGVDYAFIAAYTDTPARRVCRDFEGDGNLGVDAIAKYLHAMGLEVRVTLVGWRVDEALAAEALALAEEALPAQAETLPEWEHGPAESVGMRTRVEALVADVEAKGYSLIPEHARAALDGWDITAGSYIDWLALDDPK